MPIFPARTVLIRIAASMLPDDEQAIVPLDLRLRGNPPPGILNAWRSYPAGQGANLEGPSSGLCHVRRHLRCEKSGLQ